MKMQAFGIFFIFCFAAAVFSAENPPARLSDDFEKDFSLWQVRGESLPVITTAQKEALNNLGNATRFVMFPAKTAGTSVLELSSVAPQEDSRFVFWFKSELAPVAQIKFSLYVDNKEIFSFSGMSEWQQKYILLPKGNHSIRFEVKKTTAAYGQGIANAFFLDDVALVPNPPAPKELNETFDENVSLGQPESLWLGNAKIASNDSAAFGNSTRYVELKAPQMTGSSTLEILRITPEVNSSLSFRFKTEIAGAASQSFKVFLDGKEMGSWEGIGMMWRAESFLVPAGAHSLRFEVASKGKSVQNEANAVYIDDVILIPDTPSYITLNPLGAQQTYVGAPASGRLVFSAASFRKDNSLCATSVQKSGGGFTFAVFDAATGAYSQGARIDANGVFTAASPGAYIVTVSKDEFTVTSGIITVHDSDFLFKPYFYSGTGKTYQGYTGKPSGEIPRMASLDITYPSARSFEADGFFTLQAKITKPSSKNYAHIGVTKIASDGKTLSTSYVVHDSFTRRIWLPFGKGEYTVTITVLDSVRLTTPPGGAEGEFRGGSYSTEILTLTVFNTREDSYIDGDARWLYPSWNCQSDNVMIANALEHILRESGAQTQIEKARAIHDFVVKLLAYDAESFRNTSRMRRNDAVSALQNRTGVCEGYSNLSAALLRAAGIPVKIVVSAAVNHAWNNVYIDGAWKFFDATWDDPTPDRGAFYVEHTYFLLDSLTGGDNRHRGSGTALIGDVETF